MARDAIARQYDVEKNSVIFDDAKGTITFYAKAGKAIDLDVIHSSIKATRLSGRTGMHVHGLEITITGDELANLNNDEEMVLKMAGTTQAFSLSDDPEGESNGGLKTAFQQLKTALDGGRKVMSITGSLPAWNSHWPPFLNGTQPGKTGKPQTFIVTNFECKT